MRIPPSGRLVLLASLALTACGAPQHPTPLSRAAAAGRLADVRALLADGAQPNPEGDECVALVGAARAGHLDVARTLIAAGARLNARDPCNNGWTALITAIHTHQMTMVEFLLEAGADPNMALPSGFTALMMAAGYGEPSVVRLLLAHGADARARTRDGRTPLNAAVGGSSDIDKFTVASCQSDTVKVLLDAAPTIRLREGWPDRFARLAARIGGCADVLRRVDAREAEFRAPR